MPKVSVIIPVYGVEKYIERCARSLFEQTLDDIEYLFIDDCTPDNSINILKTILDEYPKRKSQVVIHQMEKNSGQAKVREWGMRNATGEFVIHCDSDDWIEKDMYLAMYEKAIEDNADIVICDFQYHDGVDKLHRLAGVNDTKKDIIDELLTHHLSWSLCNKLFKRSLYEGIIYPKGNMGEDFAQCMQMIIKSHRISYIPKPFYNYFMNPGSITRVVTSEQKLKNFYSNKCNIDIVLNVMAENHITDSHNIAIVVKKWGLKKMLLDITPFNKVLWIETYNEINKRILFNRYISIKDKILFILTYIGFYPKR